MRRTDPTPRQARAVRSPGDPTRRTVLLGLCAGLGSVVAGTLSGCGLRLKRDAPAVPLVPPRAVEARAVAVYGELRRVRAALAAARTAAGPAATRTAAGPSAPAGAIAAVAGTLVTVHGQQEDALLGRLRELGEDPADTARLDAAARETATPGPLALVAAEGQGLAAPELAALGRLPGDEAPLLVSLLVQRAVALPLVGGVGPAWSTPTIGSATEAARLVGVFRSAEYGLGVAAARTRSPVRDRLTAPLTWVAAVRLVLESQAGAAASELAAGYPLPFGVTDDASALRLGQVVLAGVADAVLAGVPAAVGHAPGMLGVVALTAIAEDGARQLGAAPRAFPGLVRR